MLKPEGLKEHQLRPQDHGEETLDKVRNPGVKYQPNIYNGVYKRRDDGVQNPGFQMDNMNKMWLNKWLEKLQGGFG